jgi:predicted glycosyltransferase
MSDPRPLRIALYSHDGMGLGHLRRNALIASSLAGGPLGASALLLAGAHELGRMALPPGVDCLTLPGFQKVGNGHYRPRTLRVETPRLVEMRRRAISAALDAYDPDLLLVDKIPEGLHGELLPALGPLRRRGTRIVLGLRDILDEPARVQAEWLAGQRVRHVEEHFDQVWIYGDPNVYDLTRECRFPEAFTRASRFTGYLDPLGHPLRARAEDAPAHGPTVCQVGGGQDGGALAEAFLRARIPEGTHGVLIEGPFMPPHARERIRFLAGSRPDIELVSFTPDPVERVRQARQVISMGGYNSVCEILSTRRRGLIVPRVRPRQEQRIRAERMAALGLVDWIHPDALTPAALSTWMHGDPASRQVSGAFDFSGLERLPGLISDLDPRGWFGARPRTSRRGPGTVSDPGPHSGRGPGTERSPSP